MKVAVVTQASADRAGGLAELAKGIDRDLEAKGNLILVGGPGIHLITSYAPVEPATDALRKGVQDNNDSSLADRLSRASRVSRRSTRARPATWARAAASRRRPRPCRT